MYPPNIIDFIKIFSKLPGIGPKSAERVAFYILSQNVEFAEKLAGSIIAIKKKTKKCHICGNIDVNDPCFICADPKRDNSKICVVEDAMDIYLIENMSIYNGLYHCLGGLISPLSGVKPEDLKIKELISRIKENKVKEVIFALSAIPEGDTTILYIKSLVKNSDIKFTTLARGIPVGTGLQYAGNKSLEEAFKGREEVKTNV
ncbi:MAG: recombination mediator RecR [Brevinematales bacterium]|nr:recombination mediator RecR [Brevinematales bacterium]